MIYKSPLKVGEKIKLKEGDIVIGDDNKVYMVIVHKRYRCKNHISVGCNGCDLGLKRDPESYKRCNLAKSHVLTLKHTNGVIGFMNDCFSFIDRDTIRENYISFIEIKEGGM